MKKLLITIAILIPLILSGQEQNSLLQKGLVFHWPGSEWHNQPTGSADIISGKIGTSTDVQNVMGRGGSGNRWYEFDGVNDYVALPTTTALNLTGDFTIITKLQTGSGLVINADGDNKMWWTVAGAKYIKIGGVQVAIPSNILTTTLDQTLTIKRSSGVLTFYINGASIGNGDISNTNTFLLSAAKLQEDYYYFDAKYKMTRIFNYALTPTQIANYSDTSYPIEAVDRGATGVSLVTGDNSTFATWGNVNWAGYVNGTISDGTGKLQLTGSGTVGTVLTDAYIDLTTLGKSYNVKFDLWQGTSALTSYFTQFKDKDTPITISGTQTTFNSKITPTDIAGSLYVYSISGDGGTVYLDNVSVTQLGCLLDLNPSGMGTTQWNDLTNATTATVTGAILNIPANSNLGASSFNGTTSNVAFTDGVILGSGDFTVSVWANLSINTDYRTLISGDGGCFGLRISDIGYLQTSHTEVADNNPSTLHLEINQLYLLCYTRTGGVGTYYVNGISAGTTTDTRNYSVKSNIIGSYPGIRFYYGLLSDFRVYDRPLSPDDIALLYRRGPQN